MDGLSAQAQVASGDFQRGQVQLARVQDILGLARIEAGENQPDLQSEPVESEAPGMAPLCILVVDDVPVNRLLVSALLAPFDPVLEEAADGVEAVEAAERHCFDLILMDLQMPRMDGLAATRAIRAGSGLNKTTPILAVTANVLPDHVESCRLAGMNDHIGKPISPQELLSKVGRWTAPLDNDAA